MNYREILAGLIVLLYLADCLRLLEPGEVALAAWSGKAWRARFGSRRWQLMGKDVLLANPLAPAEMLFILRWRAADTAPQEPGTVRVEQIRAAAQALGTAAWLCCGTGILAILILPTLMLLQLGTVPIIACVAALYLNIAVTALVIYSRRNQLGIPPKAIAKACAEALLCAPYGANLARRMALALPTRELRLAQAAALLLDDNHRIHAWEECRARLAELLAEFDDGSPEYRRLKAEEAIWSARP